MTEPQRLPIVKVAAVSAAVAATAGLAYYLLKKDKSSASTASATIVNANLAPFEQAQQLKELGNAQFAKHNYSEADKLFEKSVEILKSLAISPEQQQLLSTVFNNLSAAAEYQNDLARALELTDKALSINKNYTKVYIRRVRLHKKLDQLQNAVADGGYCLRLLQGSGDKILEKVNRDFLEDLTNLTAKNVENMFKKFFLTGQFLPISRLITEDWTQKIAIHDPVLNRLENIRDEATYSDPLDQALQFFAQQEHTKALELALKASLDEELSIRDRLLARLFAARIYLFAGLYREVQFMTTQFTALWDVQSEEFKVENKDLLLALWALDVYIDAIDDSERKILQNHELLKGNVDPLVVLANHCSRWGDYTKSIELIKLARTLEPEHPDLEFHELTYQFYAAAKDRNMSAVQTACANIDRYVQNNDLNAFKTLTVAKVFASLANLDLALEILDKHKDKCQNSISFELLHVLCYTEKNSTNPEVITQFREKLVDLSNKDPYNHELLSLLSRHMSERGNFEESAGLAAQAFFGVRFIQEFTIRYQDLIASYSFAGLPLPYDDIPPYKGPEHIKVTSPEWATKFEASDGV
ncbi:unnamed protein product [Bursaphelenchus xylophilus]|uniref:(pine wood nematode) hypothetical protein n=1 Tax=Bursaphelenchus xylophilus TaxID=6326 RepID=A0A1I7SR59_BURXY|nr:unnamed protein product [Bursaphelenchus xylophilus]CAG9110871.1 unnamed protein product [Bursaphelenchus xylophilus]